MLQKLLLGFITFIGLCFGSATSQAAEAPSFPHFDDQSLQTLLSNSEMNQTSGVIWIWSPRMNLSIYGLSELKPIAALLDLELTVLVDPYHPDLSLYDSNYSSLLSQSQIMS